MSDLDWKNLNFELMPTNGFVQADYSEGEWGKAEMKTDPFVPIHLAANCLHYGQACFEGLKAFRAGNNKVAMFRPDKNAKRMADSAARICMTPPPEELFIEACRMAVEANMEFVPPYGTGASLYIRPFLIGTEPMIGIKVSKTYSFFVLVTPVGPYYKNGFFPVKALVVDEYDRAAPKGTGMAKVAGNYAASLIGNAVATKKGFPIVLYLDAAEGKYIDEFGTSNFFGITADGIYKTPDSSSILKSITNDSLRALARDMGLKVEPSPISLDSCSQFEEVGACGTAAVITPISSITYGDTLFSFGKENEAGPTLKKFYDSLQGIQYGDEEDKHNWLHPVG